MQIMVQVLIIPDTHPIFTESATFGTGHLFRQVLDSDSDRIPEIILTAKPLSQVQPGRGFF
jgi:hypothetical protein